MNTDVIVDEILALVKPHDDEERSERHSWQPVDLSDVLDGRYVPPMPTVGGRSDGVPMFYPGRLHTVAGESEALKTFLVLSAANLELARGNAVVYLDFEDDEGGVVGKLLAIGADRDAVRDRFAYLRPDESIEALGNRGDLEQVLGDLNPTLAILDGVTEAMSLHGLELKDNSDVAKFGQLLPRRIASVACDHVVKDRENRGRYAVGGVHKLNGLNGGAYLLENRQKATIGGVGRSTVYLSKDRPGQLRRHALPGREGLWWFGDLVVTSHGEDYVEVNLTPPAAGDDETFRPTVVMARLAAALDKHGPLSQRKLLAIVKGNKTTAINALTFLQIDGYVSDKTPTSYSSHTRPTETSGDPFPRSQTVPKPFPRNTPCTRSPVPRSMGNGERPRITYLVGRVKRVGFTRRLHVAAVVERTRPGRPWRVQPRRRRANRHRGRRPAAAPSRWPYADLPARLKLEIFAGREARGHSRS